MKITFPFLQSVVLSRAFSHPTQEKIFSFSLLKNGWNYGEGEIFSPEAIKSAIELHREIIFRGYSKTDAFPGLDGEIQITIYEGDHYFAFEREAENEWSITHEINGKIDTVSGLNFENVIKYLNSDSMLCNVSDYYRGNTIGIKYLEDSTTWPSSQGLTEYQSLMRPAALA